MSLWTKKELNDMRRANARMYKVLNDDEIIANLIFTFDPPKNLENYVLVPEYAGKVTNFVLVKMVKEK